MRVTLHPMTSALVKGKDTGRSGDVQGGSRVKTSRKEGGSLKSGSAGNHQKLQEAKKTIPLGL